MMSVAPGPSRAAPTPGPVLCAVTGTSAVACRIRRFCARQQTPHGRAKLRERVKVEHTLAHVGRWQGRRARYLGRRNNLFDLRRVAVVHNLHVIARQPSPAKQAA
jgi:hypothetical protein